MPRLRLRLVSASTLAAVLTLVLGLAAGGPPVRAQEPDPTMITLGTLQLALGEHGDSGFELDTEALADAVCGEGTFPGLPDDDRGGGTEDGRLVVGGGGSQARSMALLLTINAVSPVRGDGSATVTAQAAALYLVGVAPLASACGLWDAWISLDARRPQPRSSLELEPATAREATGLFVGTLHLLAELHLSPTGGGAAQHFPLALDLDLGGRWTVLPGGVAPAGESSLVLLADLQGISWLARPGCAQGLAATSRLCLEATASTLDLLASLAY